MSNKELADRMYVYKGVSEVEYKLFSVFESIYNHTDYRNGLNESLNRASVSARV